MIISAEKQYEYASQLGLLEGILAGLLQPAPETQDAIDSLDKIVLANATDLPTAIALANANKAAINEIIDILTLKWEV
uniref:Uncharacterized protein n=2 Tax=unclassified bacterial viruses TaxID=12333 RepID=A0AAU6VZR2_9VIRU